MTASGTIVRRPGSWPAPTPAGGERDDIALDCAERVVLLLALRGL